MKKFIITVFAIAVGFVQANAMSHERAQAEALFLTDKMAYELNLTDAQYDAVYEINYDYFVSLVGTSDILGIFWNRRERELEWVLTSRQYRDYLATAYFYHPVVVYNNTKIRFVIYDTYAHNRFYKPIRKVHHTYRGGYAYKAPSHPKHGYAHVGKPHNGGHRPEGMKPGNGGHKPGGVKPNNGGANKPSVKPNNSGANKPSVKPNNGGSKPSNNGNVKPNNGGSKPSGAKPATNAGPRRTSNNAPARSTSSNARTAGGSSNGRRAK
ncbi:MAG: hypothetical protein J6X89_01200 [Bacteroidales bacterium]|nr:hypothetical protein [Bacteroidales bacterium]